ncbi:MAG: hypothetical protein QNJ46_25405 [Leptolyngbyaceae cyanobacterium MO_188.B28]|nr:hypothetical protein [Leptolyngbyaceae cyanobacterium MO_188.B28]
MPNKILIERTLDELVLASFGQFQIGVLSTQTKAVNQFCLGKALIARRQYESIGWLFHKDCHLGWIQALEIQPLENPGPFKIAPRLGAAIPTSFEVRSERPLPEAISDLSCFSCLVPEEISPYCTVFRKMRPRYVKAFAFTAPTAMAKTLRQFMQAEEAFVAENRQRLVQVPFYKSSFGL